jgi:hypothetical protein
MQKEHVVVPCHVMRLFAQAHFSDFHEDLRSLLDHKTVVLEEMLEIKSDVAAKLLRHILGKQPPPSRPCEGLIYPKTKQHLSGCLRACRRQRLLPGGLVEASNDNLVRHC